MTGRVRRAALCGDTQCTSELTRRFPRAPSPTLGANTNETGNAPRCPPLYAAFLVFFF